MSSKGVLLGFGHPLLDITAEVTSDFLARFKLEPDGVILGGPDQETLVQELVESKDFKVRYSAGGATQNTVRVAQWVLRRPLSGAFVGTIGKDNFGEMLREQAEMDGVDVGYVVDKVAGTGVCAVLVTKDTAGVSRRSLVSFIGAASNFNRLQLLQKWPMVQKAKVYYCAGFTIRTGYDAVLEMAQHASDVSDKTFALNLSAPYVCETFKDKLVTLLPLVDILFGNATEALALAKALNWQVDTVAEVLEHLAKVSPSKKANGRLVIITQGEEAVLVAGHGSEGIRSFAVPSIPKEKVLDSNAAGDAFVGGFLAMWVLGKQVSLCVQSGIYCAGRILHVSGCNLSTFGPFDEENISSS